MYPKDTFEIEISRALRRRDSCRQDLIEIDNFIEFLEVSARRSWLR